MPDCPSCGGRIRFVGDGWTCRDCGLTERGNVRWYSTRFLEADDG